MGLVDGKSVTGNRRDKVDSGQDNVVQTGFLLKAGQDDQILSSEEVGLKNLIRYPGYHILRVEGIFAKLNQQDS